MIRYNEQGVAALLTIIIVAAATLIMAASASLLSLGEIEQGYISQKGDEALSVAEGCTEEVLRRTRFDSDYSANTTTTLTVSNGTCTIFVEQSGTNSTSTIVGTVTDQNSSYNKKIRAMYGYNASGRIITLTKWEEVID
jgi:hypothetical protein